MQLNKMLRFKSGEFLQIFAKKRALLITFVKFLTNSCSFYSIFSRFFLAPFTQTTHASNQHSLLAQKQACPFEKQKNTSNPHQFFKFQNSHFPAMLICITFKNVILTDNYRRVCKIFICLKAVAHVDSLSRRSLHRSRTCLGVASAEDGPNITLQK